MSTDNYVEPILAALATDPDRVVSRQDGGETFTRGEFAVLIYRFARVFAEHGVRPGATVTLLSPNRAEVLAARYAAGLLGARVVSLYEGIAAATQAVIVSDVDTDLLVADPALSATVTEILATAPVKAVLGFGPGSPGADLLALAEAAASTVLEPYPVSPDDIFSIRHTGGTTGHPKGIVLPFRSPLALVDFARSVSPESGKVQLVFTPLGHMAGSIVDAVFVSGGELVLRQGFDAAAVLAAVERYRVTDLLVLPPHLYALMDHPAVDKHDLSSLRQIGYGGCPASPGRLAEAVDRFGPVLLQVYGATEAGGIAFLGPEEHARPELLATVGKPHPATTIAIRDPEGRDLPAGEPGEICVRSPLGGLGYWRDPEATARVWRDGWVHTGDVGFFDEEGYLHLAGRIKDIIIVVGGHVYPVELEEVLLGHPAVGAVAVYGVADADRTERVHAAIVPKPGQTAELGELREFVTERLGAMYAPHEVHVVEEIPLTDAGKPDLKLLRAKAG
ncbi:AMP-binding protein [Amycolatopsis sp. NPDC059021]|uniref:AMP-binding protein n=1 Tax=Amycolatopsis sp. NPDC059021 TaxID=3346704 RepID=UPI00366D84C6